MQKQQHRNWCCCFFLFFGAEGGTRTLAPIFKRASRLAGGPLHRLEYFCNSFLIIAFLLYKVNTLSVISCLSNIKNKIFCKI